MYHKLSKLSSAIYEKPCSGNTIEAIHLSIGLVSGYLFEYGIITSLENDKMKLIAEDYFQFRIFTPTKT